MGIGSDPIAKSCAIVGQNRQVSYCGARRSWPQEARAHARYRPIAAQNAREIRSQHRHAHRARHARRPLHAALLASGVARAGSGGGRGAAGAASWARISRSIAARAARPHAVAHRCAHRRTMLSAGFVEGDCIRCLYHGWKYDADGNCVEQPAELNEAFSDKVRIRAYPTHEYLGLIFVFMGEGATPPPPRFPEFEEPGGLVNANHYTRACNYYQRHRERRRRGASSLHPPPHHFRQAEP